MFSFAERWCDSSPRVRLGLWFLMVLLLAVVVAIATRTQGQVTASELLKAQWQKVMLLRSSPSEFSPGTSEPFSALDFDGPESRLLSWQPAGKSGELMLEADWAVIPSLFSRLAERRQAVRGFSIQPEAGRLTLTLQLEAIDDE